MNHIKMTGLKIGVYFFSVYFDPIDTNNILDINKYLIKRTWYEIMFELIKKIFIGLLTGLFNGSNHAMCVLLINQKWNIRPVIINLYPTVT